MNCSINNFLSVILLVVFVLLLFSTYSSNQLKEMFFEDPSCYDKPDKKCYYSPMGQTKDSCVLRCLAGKEAWGGDLCTEDKCTEICDKSTNPTPPPNRQVLDDLIMVIPSNKKVKIYVNMDKINKEIINPLFVEYYLTNNKLDGVYYRPIQKVIDINNLINNKEYSFTLVGENKQTGEYEPLSHLVTATCSQNNKLL